MIATHLSIIFFLKRNTSKYVIIFSVQHIKYKFELHTNQEYKSKSIELGLDLKFHFNKFNISIKIKMRTCKFGVEFHKIESLY